MILTAALQPCTSYWNKVGNGGVQSVFSDWRAAIQCKYLQSPEPTKTTYESHYIFPLIIKLCDSKLICQYSSTWCQWQLCTHPQEWEQEAEAGQEDAVEAVAPPGGGQRGAAHVDDQPAAVARAGHAQPVTLLAHTVLGHDGYQGAHITYWPPWIVSISPDPYPSTSKEALVVCGGNHTTKRTKWIKGF